MMASGQTNQRTPKPSKYFPSSAVLYLHPDSEEAGKFFEQLAERQVKAQACKGITTIRLWKDADDALDKDHRTDPYQQYLLMARKAAARLIGKELQGEGTGITWPNQRFRVATAASPNPLGRFNPQAEPFVPTASGSKQTLHHDGTQPASPALATFEENCKKRGVRLSSP
ncbi:hypothetical protein F5Y05DRAFT_86622 [Hypoxylon sp. FL0543]|nr:hypothetical protein F5Y05DRAFT_86622 [Hypoxylon sp. FL0543]